MDLTWEQAEVMFPESSVCFDRDGGDEWCRHGDEFMICAFAGRLYVWFIDLRAQEDKDNSWGLWDEDKKQWIFL